MARVRSMSSGKQAMRLTGHCVIWLLHQNVRKLSGTLEGSIWYVPWADAIESRALEAMTAAVEVFMVWIVWIGINVRFVRWR